MLSNSNCKEVIQTFSKDSWKVVKIQANRAINSNSKKRTGHTELLIKNY
jgi:DNA adenine methylase